MKLIKAALTALFFIISFPEADAQPPGYLGKRWIVSYDIFALPALRNFNENGERGITAFNTRHEFSVDWVIGLKQSVGMSLHLTKSQFKFSDRFDYTYYDSYWEEETSRSIKYGSIRGQLSAFAIGLHTHMYFNKLIAPLGAYFKPEILLINFSATFDSAEFKKNVLLFSNLKSENYPVPANKSSYFTMAIGATLGTHYVFLERILINVGFQFGYLLGGQTIDEYINTHDLLSVDVDQDNLIPVSAKDRLFSQYFINVNAGLGILIY
jgi:hypothetical protein